MLTLIKQTQPKCASQLLDFLQEICAWKIQPILKLYKSFY